MSGKLGSDVAVLMGSKSDLEIMRPAAQTCRKLGLSVDVRVLSAHRTPEQTAAYVRDTAKAGTKVFICGAGGAAHLAGASRGPHHPPSLACPLRPAACKAWTRFCPRP